MKDNRRYQDLDVRIRTKMAADDLRKLASSWSSAATFAVKRGNEEAVAALEPGQTVPQLRDDRPSNDYAAKRANEACTDIVNSMRATMRDLRERLADVKGQAPSEEALRAIAALRDMKSIEPETLDRVHRKYGGNWLAHSMLADIAQAKHIDIDLRHDLDGNLEQICDSMDHAIDGAYFRGVWGPGMAQDHPISTRRHFLDSAIDALESGRLPAAPWAPRPEEAAEEAAE